MKIKRTILAIGVCGALFIGGFAVYAFSYQEKPNTSEEITYVEITADGSANPITEEQKQQFIEEQIAVRIRETLRSFDKIQDCSTNIHIGSEPAAEIRLMLKNGEMLSDSDTQPIVALLMGCVLNLKLENISITDNMDNRYPIIGKQEVIESGNTDQIKPGNTDFEYLLKTQIDQSQDNYLAMYSENDEYLEILKLDTIHYGRFTKPDRHELMAIFKVEDAPHAAGLDRTIAAVYDVESMKIMMQKTFAADIVSIYFLRSFYYGSTTANILFIGSTTYQSHTSYVAECYSLADSDWREIPLPVDNTDNNLAYAITDNAILHIFTLGYPDVLLENGSIAYDALNPEYIYLDSFFWNDRNKIFVKNID